MISLPTKNVVVEDSEFDSHIQQGDIVMSFTYAEHEMMTDIMLNAITAMDFAIPYGICDLPIDNNIVQRYTMIENIRERFVTLWADRFEPIQN